MKYTCIFFDLDHTLWDYETNSKETLAELYHAYKLNEKGVSEFEFFLEEFKKVNQELWHLYDHGKIDSDVIRNERFKKILGAFQIHDSQLYKNLSEDYIRESPRKGGLIPDAINTLNYLTDRYSLTVVTNGFEDIQYTKLSSGKLTGYFDHIVTSQKAGHKKPAREIFDFALGLNGISRQQAVMIGDNLTTDIAGAKNASIDTVFFNPDKVKHEVEVNHEIHSLSRLCELL